MAKLEMAKNTNGGNNSKQTLHFYGANEENEFPRCTYKSDLTNEGNKMLGCRCLDGITVSITSPCLRGWWFHNALLSIELMALSNV